VVWHSVAPPGDRDLLNRWCDSVGPPLTMSGAPPPPSLTTLVIATWNVHAGNGDVEAFLASLAKLPGVRPPYGVVLLLQEAVRAGVEVPERYPDLMRPPRGIRARRREYEVASLGERLALHVAYVPSMRNGRLFPSDAREDRGNAILSTLPLSDLRAMYFESNFQKELEAALAALVGVNIHLLAETLAPAYDPEPHHRPPDVALWAKQVAAILVQM